MKKQLGCLSSTGTLVTLLVIAVVVSYTLLEGGRLFSPGPTTAANPQDTPLGGYSSHAEFENECTRCHRPWRGADPQRCVACHNSVRDQIIARDGLHGQLQNPGVCILCHTEHQGRDANITAAALVDFPHQQFGFSLAHHRQRADDQPFACTDCHLLADYVLDQAICERCHAELEAAFMTQHTVDFGWDCLACHDGSGALADFDHNAVFALDGAHASVECTGCHMDGMYDGLPSSCVACHEEPNVHRGQFGIDCTACHSTQAWTPARLLVHTFSLDHGSRVQIACQVCHPTNYITYTCYDCHEHEPAEIERKHIEVSIYDFVKCVDCHPTGLEDEHGDD